MRKKAKKLQHCSFTQSLELFFGGHEEGGLLAPPDLPRLVPIEISELLVIGHAIRVPHTQSGYWEEPEYMQFEALAEPLLAGEVLVLPEVNSVLTNICGLY